MEKRGLISTKKTYIFSFNGFSKMKSTALKQFYLKRKNQSIFNKAGTFTIKQNEANIIKYLKKLSASRKKWQTYKVKKQYIRRHQYKKRKKRIKKYIKKTILAKKLKNYYKILNLTNRSIVREKQRKKFVNSKYNIYYFELINLKIRFLSQYIYIYK